MALHRIICKLSGPEGLQGPQEPEGPTAGSETESVSDPVVEETEPTNVVSTPDLYISESDDESVGPEGAGGSR